MAPAFWPDRDTSFGFADISGATPETDGVPMAGGAPASVSASAGLALSVASVPVVRVTQSPS